MILLIKLKFMFDSLFNLGVDIVSLPFKAVGSVVDTLTDSDLYGEIEDFTDDLKQ
jgi:hypothetical protein